MKRKIKNNNKKRGAKAAVRTENTKILPFIEWACAKR